MSSSLLDAIRINLGQIITSSFNERRIPSNKLIERIKDKNIIEFIFGNSSHIQLIQKSNDLVKCLLMGNALSQSDLVKIFDLTKSNDIETKNSIYKILQTNYNHFSTELASFLINKILEKGSESICPLDLDLIGQVYKSMNTSKQFELSKVIVESYKNMIISGKLNNENNENMVNELVSILKTFEMRDNRVSFVENLLKDFKNRKEVKTILKLDCLSNKDN